MSVKYFYKLSIAIAATCTLAFGGGANGAGGGDTPPFSDGSVWFVGQRPIRYCMQISPDFGVGTKVIQASLETAFKTWQQYLRWKWINQLHTGDVESIEFNSIYMKSCDGSEDLTFYLGVQNAQVSHEKAKYHNPIGFVSRTKYDPKLGWGKGFVWISPSGSVEPENNFPDWNKTNTLTSISQK